MRCLLCDSLSGVQIQGVSFHQRSYFNCQNCDFIFASPDKLLTDQAERARYETHQNTSEDIGYVHFLSQILPLMTKYKCLEQKLKILDYGCGPAPVFSEILKKTNIDITNYDLYFNKDKSIFEKKWDVIIASEVFEHFRDPKSEFKQIHNILEVSGYLFIRTLFHPGLAKLKEWWYPKDPTHISFYSEKCFAFLGEKYQLQLLECKSPFVVFRKNN